MTITAPFIFIRLLQFLNKKQHAVTIDKELIMSIHPAVQQAFSCSHLWQRDGSWIENLGYINLPSSHALGCSRGGKVTRYNPNNTTEWISWSGKYRIQSSWQTRPQEERKIAKYISDRCKLHKNLLLLSLILDHIGPKSSFSREQKRLWQGSSPQVVGS